MHLLYVIASNVAPSTIFSIFIYWLIMAFPLRVFLGLARATFTCMDHPPRLHAWCKSPFTRQHSYRTNQDYRQERNNDFDNEEFNFSNKWLWKFKNDKQHKPHDISRRRWSNMPNIGRFNKILIINIVPIGGLHCFLLCLFYFCCNSSTLFTTRSYLH